MPSIIINHISVKVSEVINKNKLDDSAVLRDYGPK